MNLSPIKDESLEGSTNTAPSDDSISMAKIYRDATNADAEVVRKVMADPSLPTDDSVQFYLIPSAWMSACKSFLDGNGQERPEKKIHNTSLIASSAERKISSDDEDEDESGEKNDSVGENENARRRRLRRERWQAREKRNQALAKEATSLTLQSNLKLNEDFTLVGPNAWMLLSGKFGFDLALPRPIVFTTPDSEQSSVAAVAIQEGTDSMLLSIPPSGTFTDITVDIKKTEYMATTSVPSSPTDDEGNTSDCAIAENNPAETDVVSEDEDVTNDLFPSVDNGVNENEAPPHSLILLPPSTTTANHVTNDDNLQGGRAMNGNNDQPVSAVQQEMELESEGLKSTTTADVAAVTTNKRKRYGAGLGNLGNTCFMNSTLQCLAHTEPLRHYFVSGEYQKHLNRDNPLGTGGELATQFAELLMEMWGCSRNKKAAVNGYYGGRQTYGSSSSASPISSVVYPRNFKYTLGKHAEQFLGYDQHDSQELATYLLDALHEDTNRVTKKPYIEKPEQGEDESDDVAAAKSWELHLQREDSRVLENFMGQVKSRVQCPTQGCGRVSTTFDPFMYLSVPIPGATDRTLTVTFVPANPKERMKNVTVTLSKTASIAALQKKLVSHLKELGFDGSDGERGEPILPEDICLADVWSNEIYSFYKLDDEIDKIRDTDTTFAFQLRSISSIHQVAPKESKADLDAVEHGKRFRSHRIKLDGTTVANLSENDEWMNTLEQYVRQPTFLYLILNPKRGIMDDRVNFFVKLENFLEELHQCSDANDNFEGSVGSLPRLEERTGGQEKHTDEPNEAKAPTLEEQCETSSTFHNVLTSKDLAILEHCCMKLRIFILRLGRDKQDKHKDGLIVHLVFQRRPPQLASVSSRFSSTGVYSGNGDRTFTQPLALRIPSSMTVYQLREELSKRLSRSLKTTNGTNDMTADRPTLNGASDTVDVPTPATQQISSAVPVDTEPEESADTVSTDASDGMASTEVMADKMNLGSPEMLVMRQIPMTCEKKNAYSTYKSAATNSTRLGMLEREYNSDITNERPISLASPSDEAENQMVAESVGNLGTVYLHWPTELSELYLDLDEYEACEEMKMPRARNANLAKSVTVSDCIEKYCQKEQLEESEMWYCNRCKGHVQAWKQFHLYRAPPILIVHLKRFHFSASTHRRDKIDSYIDFPLSGLDLTNEVMHWTGEEKPIYDCYAVSNHYGGLGGGHYTAYAMSDDNKWCHFDDSRVTTGIDPKEVKSSAAYCLYYRRRDVVRGNDNFFEACPPPVVPVEQEEPPQEHTASRFAQEHTAARFAQELAGAVAGRNRVEDMEVDPSDAGASRRSSHTSSSPVGSMEQVDGDSTPPYWDDDDGRQESSRDEEWSDMAQQETNNDFPLQ